MVRKPVNQSRGPASQTIPYTVNITPSEKPGIVPPTQSSVEKGADIGQADLERLTDGRDSAHSWQSTKERGSAQKGRQPFVTAEGDKEDTNGIRTGDVPAALRIGSRETTPRSSWEGSKSSTPDMDTLLPTRQLPASNNPYRQVHDDGIKAERVSHDGESSAHIWDEKATVFGNVPASLYQTRHPFAEPWMKFETSPESPLEPAGMLPEIGHQTAHDPTLTSMPADDKDRAAHAPIPGANSLSPQAVPYVLPQDLGRASIPTSITRGQEILRERERTFAAQLDSPKEYAQRPTKTAEAVSPLHVDEASANPWAEPNEKTASFDPFTSGSGTPLLSKGSHQEQLPPPQPPKPPKTTEIDYGVAEAKVAGPTRPDEPVKKQKGETYQIRLVNWYDISSPVNPRRSPIMVQNSNGPCPLLALVNALVLSTPSGIDTALIETLRVREQVSLGLLLDAVIDELMSGRRGIDLPDFTDLYAFLVNLHTGMNVNPRFVPVDSEALSLIDAPIEDGLPSNINEHRQAGGFEDTREMKLYSTFTIPLIHGWLPPRNHPACASLKRSAKTYEDAQNLMFREEELEEKLRRHGLSSTEQVTLEDIANVKYFLSSTATQLTGYGLDTMTEALAPGSIAILFRNDHFSTLYRHPRSGQILTLVTDMGYAGHEEVVWESLVDVSGEGCEFFSGDFRPVGNVAGDTHQQALSDNVGWTTVGNNSQRSQRKVSAKHSSLPPLSTLKMNNNATPLFPNTEQEDHDLALAMQLQEEEEERERQEAAKRRRDDELSQAYLNNADSSGRRTFPGFGRGATRAQNGPTPPPRGNGSSRPIPDTNRPVPQRKPSISDDAPPPTYEQAAKGPPYIPPDTQSAQPLASPSPSVSTQRPLPLRPRVSSAYSEHAASYSGSPNYGSGRRGHNARASIGGGNGGVDPGMVRRRSGGPNSAISPDDETKKDKECIVM